MPLKAIDYKKSIIYTIKTGDNVYIGSTTNFTTRKGRHKSSIYNQNCKEYNLKLYKTIRDNGWNWDMKPYKEYPCENRTQLIIEEERLRKELNADLNMMCCGTGLSKNEQQKQYNFKNKDKISEQRNEYNIKNKDKISEKQKEYKIKNKDKISEQQKQYYTVNKDKKTEQNKQYRIENKDKLLEQRKQKITCECGCVVSRSHLTRHKTSNKHIKRMEKK